MTPEAKFTRKEAHRKQPRMKGCTQHRLTALVKAVGPDEADYVVGDNPKPKKPACWAKNEGFRK